MSISEKIEIKNKGNMKDTERRGISLIALIITIIIIVIITGTIIINLAGNNPIREAKISVNLTEVNAVQTALDLYMLSNIDLTGNFTKYPTGHSVLTNDLDDVMKERVAQGQGVSLSEEINYTTLFYLDRNELGLNNIEENKYFIDTQNGIVYINRGIELTNGMVYILAEAGKIQDQISELIGTVIAQGNNTYILKDNGDMYSVGETGLYNQMLLSENSVYDINTQPQKVSLGYEVGDRVYKQSTTTVILKNNGDVYGFGGNTNGELGLGDTYPRYTLTKLPLNNIVEIHSSTSGTIVALKDDGTIVAAGNNSNRVIKDTSELQIPYFTNITYNLDGSENNKITGIVNIGATSANIYVVLVNGEVWAWGENQFGVLDNYEGSRVTLLPKRMTEIEDLKTINSSDIKKITSGSSQCNFVLLDNGELYSKGYGGYNGTPGSATTTTYNKIFDNTFNVVSTGTTAFLLDNNGDVYAWGNNSTFSMGLELSTTYYIPTKLNISNIIELEIGLALTMDGKLHRIGKTQDILNKEIENVPMMKKIYSLYASIDIDNNLWMFGSNLFGQLAVADKGSKNLLTKSSLSNIQTIQSGGSNYIVRTGDGKLIGAGANVYNQISSVSTSNVINPTIINFAGEIIDHAVSERNLYLIDSNNDLWAVGNSSYGQMGEIGNRTLLTKFTAQNLKFSKVFAKNRMVFALTTDGMLYACGQEDYGEIGLGTGTGVFGSSRIHSFTQVISDNNLNDIDFSKLIKIVGGTQFSVLLLDDGSVYFTGVNTNGQSGLGDYEFKSRWTKNTFFENKAKVIDVQSGTNFTVFLLENGDIYTTGNNSYGQFGNGTKISSNIPVKANISNVQSIAVGSGHVIAVKTDKTSWSYGKGSHGQLGNGRIAQDISSPIRAYELEK